MQTLTIKLPQEIDVDKTKLLISALLFEKGILSSGQAAEMAGVTRKKFLEEVGKYGVSVFGETIDDLKKSKILNCKLS